MGGITKASRLGGSPYFWKDERPSNTKAFVKLLPLQAAQEVACGREGMMFGILSAEEQLILRILADVEAEVETCEECGCEYPAVSEALSCPGCASPRY